MSVLYEQCKNKSSSLISPLDIVRLVGDRKLSQSKTAQIVSDLHKDGYFDIIYSDRRGETIYCISLTEKGKAFQRNAQMMKRNVFFKVCLSFTLAVFSFLVGLILRAIF